MTQPAPNRLPVKSQRLAGTGIDEATTIDTYVEVVTPENVSFDYRIAGPFRRFWAFLLDMLIIIIGLAILSITWSLLYGLALRPLAIYMGIAGFIDSINELVSSALMVVTFCIWWFYGSYMEAKYNGRTFGKMLLNLRVLTLEGRPINGLQATLRTFARAADALPVVTLQQLSFVFAPFFAQEGIPVPPVPIIPTFAVAIFFMIMTKRYQRLGDVICGTMVVFEEKRWLANVTRIDEPAAVELAMELPAGFVVTPKLAQALAGYVGKRMFFPELRRYEIASRLAQSLSPKLGLSSNTNPDLVLCALYYRTFMTPEQVDEIEYVEPQKPATDRSKNPYESL